MLYKEFVPYEPSLDMKELGFDEPCFGYHLTKDLPYVKRGLKFGSEKYVGKHNSYDDFIVSAPTFSQAFRWLLKHYNLYGVIIPTITMNWTFKTMTVVEDIMEVPPYKHIDANDYKTPEEAELACLDKLIEIVKNK